jgi:hypothetical protein
MATPLASIRNAWWALLFAYAITGLSLCTLNGDWLAHAAGHVITRIMETATVAAPTERPHEKARRHLTEQTQRLPLFVGPLLREDVSGENITIRRRAAVALVLLAASDR